MDKKGYVSGSDVLSVIVAIALIVLALAAGLGGCFNKHVIGNKQYFDFHQNFKYAYITEGTNVVKYQIKAWKDWNDSDAVQVITVDDRAIYTHLSRVLLVDRQFMAVNAARKSWLPLADSKF